MKRFMVYAVIVITFLFFGFTIYYLTRNHEQISLTISSEEGIYLNKDETYMLPITWTKPNSSTTMEVAVSDPTVVSYDQEAQKFTATKGGFTSVTITTSNENFGPFVFEIYVGDGTIENPYYIKDAEELDDIGSTLYPASASYQLIDDIDLNQDVWTPLPEYSGNFNGNGHIIHNLKLKGNGTAGLFQKVAHGGLVENIKFSNATINGDFINAGVVAGVNAGTIGKIDVVSATITNTSTGNVGVIAGSNIYDTTAGVINMCSASATITSAGNVGGLVGHNKSALIINSKSEITSITASNQQTNFGGIVGKNESEYLSSKNDKGEDVVLYYSPVIKNVVSVIKAASGTANMGAIVGANIEGTTSAQVLFYNSYFNNIYSLGAGVQMDSVAVGKEIITADSLNNITSKTNQELLQQSTYSNFNFDGVWLLNENQIASINFDGNYESHRMAPYGSEITQDDKPLLDFLNDLRVNPSNNVTYNITKNFTLDLNGAVWSTIAPDIKKPILASIIVDEDVVCEITNFRLAQANNSFFGYIGAGSEISGLKFTNVTVDSCSQPSSAIVTTTVLRGATLQDITVEYNEINTDAQNVGIISAENQGTINNCHVANSANKTLTVPSSQVAKNVGGIVGNNAGLVNNCSVGGVNMIITTTNYTDGSFNIGGIAGVTESNISNSKVYGFNLETTNKGSMYAGGVVGYIKAAALSINKCFSYANLKIITENENAYVGGISAYVSAGSTVFGCFYSTGELKAYHVGGLSAHNYGTVTQSYAGESQLTGMFVAGLAPYHGGKFIDCYTLVNMTGLNKKSYLNGFAYRPYEGCLVEHCFSNATFSGEGHYWCETSALIRATDILDWLNEYLRTGDFVNNIVLPNNGARIQYMVEVLKIAPGWIDASVDQCKGNVGNYDVFKNAWFDGVDTWNFDTAVNEANGGFPTLKNVAVDE